MIAAPEAAGMLGGRPDLKKKNLKPLQKVVTKLKQKTTKVVTHQVKPEWRGKGEGLIQVLWERVFIGVNCLKEYRLRAEDEVCNLIPEFLLVHMIE